MSTTSAATDRGAAVTGALVVVAANVLYLAGLPLILDPMMSMEPFYIHMAQQPVARILREDPAWGPLYALWLKPFLAALGDPLAVYTANLYALSIGVSILIYLYLLLLTRRAAVAAGAALFFLISDLNVPLSSKVSGFAVMIILAGLTVSELVPAGARRTTVAAAGVFLASHARPELYPAALCLCLAAIWLAGRESGSRRRRVLLWPATAVAVILISAFAIGTPLFSPHHDSNRLLIAFKEHFGWNWSRWNGEWKYFESIWEQEFGGAQTMLQALLNNPGAVMRHFADNLLGTMTFMTTGALDHYPVLVPATWPALVTVENLMLTAAVFISLLLVAVRAGSRRQMWDRYGHVSLPFVALATSSFAAATVIYPLAHYLVVPGVLLLLAGALAATLITPAGPAPTWRTRALAAAVCLAVIPRPFVLPSAYVVPGSPFKARIAVTRPVTDTIALIRSLGLPQPVKVLTLTDGIGELLGPGFDEIKVWQKGAQPLESYVRDNHVAVIVTMEPGHNSFVFADPYWNLVQNDPDAAGFTRLPMANHEAVRVFVRTDLMSGTQPSAAAAPNR